MWKGRASLLRATANLYYEWDGENGRELLVLEAKEFSGIASGCPFGELPHLPPGTLGVVLWNGRLLPVVDLSEQLGPQYAEMLQRAQASDRLAYLIASDPSGRGEVAFALPGGVRTFCDDEGDDRYVRVHNLSVKDILAGSREHDDAGRKAA